MCPDLSFICQFAAFTSAAHATGEAISMPTTATITEAKSGLLLLLAVLTPAPTCPSYFAFLAGLPPPNHTAMNFG
jgi:hypothetical protein